MCMKEKESEIIEQFDRFMRQTIFSEGNKFRIEKGLPPLTEKEMGGIHLPGTQLEGSEDE